MGRLRNPYDNAMMEGSMKMLKVDGVYPWPSTVQKGVAQHLPYFIASYNERRLDSNLGYLRSNRFEKEQPRRSVKAAA